MIPAPFDYEVAESVEHAVELLGSREDAKLLAGGHSLLPLLRLRFARPSLLVDIGRLDELSYVRDAGDSIAIGALTRHHDSRRPAPPGALPARLVRGRADRRSAGAPSRHDRRLARARRSGLGPAGGPARARRARSSIAGPDGERTVAAAEFFRGVFETAVGPQEMLTEIRVPKLGDGPAGAYLKFSRRAQDWATVGVAAVVRRDERLGKVGDARIALTNMGATPLRATAVEQALVAGEADPAAYMAEGTDPPTDTAASAEFRSHLARVIGKRAIEEAIAR